jgi:hypothetical protein
VGIDRPDDPDVPPDKHSDHPARRAPAETRNREDYYADLHAATAAQERTEPVGRSEPGARSKPGEQTEPVGRSEPGARSKPGEQTEPTARSEPEAPSKPSEPTENGQQARPGSNWEETAELSRWMWTEYKRRWPPEERPAVDRSKDPPGTWHGEGGRVLEPTDNERVDAACDRIAVREEKAITPALRAVERQDPHRHLVGLEDCRKGRDRIKEKVCGMIQESGFSSEEAVSHIPDAIRYTFQYSEERYTQGVLADIASIRHQGLKLDILKNSWSDDQYKGINSQWTEPDTGQRLEVQFHTSISFEAKQITHGAYERLRAGQQPDKFEQMVLEAFQKRVTAEVPVPPGAIGIPDYPERETDAR